jgi:murein DD-endopeptidase MepM/ murein hydrolase activator NlpD
VGTSSLYNAYASRATGGRGSYGLGLDPPLENDGGTHSDLDRRRVSVRWLAGTILTGLAGAGLIGGAVYATLDPSVFMAEQPQIAVAERPASRAEGSSARKGDRIFKSVDVIAARQTFRTPTTVRSGDREIVRQRTFTKVATTLAMGPSGFASDVPPFNPLKLLAGGPQAEAVPEPEINVRGEEADVSFVSLDLAPVSTFPDGYLLSEEEIAAQLAEFLRAAGRDAARTSLAIPPQLLLTRTSRAAIDPLGLSYANAGDTRFSTVFSSIEVRMVPENVTLIGRADAQHRDTEERVVVVRRNETIEDILAEAGANRETIRRIVAALGARRGQAAVSEGQRLRIMFADLDANGKPTTIARLSVFTDEREEATVALADSGEYVQIARAEPTQAPRRPASEEDDEEDSGAMRLYNSFFETALKQEIPRPVIEELVRIFANDIDFQRSVAGGDSFTAFYEESDEGDGRPDLLYASITARGETYRYYRFHSTDDGLLDYYDQQGRSTRKFLIRKPIVAGEQRSGFGMRRHPIMGYTRMHTGVDWAAPRGTPIVAAGNGTVIKAARESGYGNRVEIQHGNGYITTYNHMSGFARGIREGVRVRQGQVIGFLGSTGLSTGPHLHYEVIVNGNFVDPLRIRLARTRELGGRQLADFRRERDRIDELMQRAPAQQRFAARTD